jgi:hypothetical protein
VSRGFRWGVYVDDTDQPWALRVDGDHFLAPERGWSPAEGLGYAPLPRMWTPRKAVGIDSSGRMQSAIVATTSAPLWTGEITAFDVEANDNTIVAVTVTATLSEYRFTPA